MDYLYRLVDSDGRVVSGYNKDTNFYTSRGSAKAARTQLKRPRWGGEVRELKIQVAAVSEFEDVDE